MDMRHGGVRAVRGALFSDMTAGTALLGVFAVGIFTLGLAYLLLAATTTLLPGDIRYLGMDRPDLCREAGCHIIDFITHNRAAYGGALMAAGLMSGWLVVGPLRNGEAWAWWTLLVAGAVECGCSIGFIAYGQTQAYGFGTWHVATIVLVTISLAGGLLLTRSLLQGSINPLAAFREPGTPASARSAEGRGRLFFVFLAFGFVVSGMSVLLVALTSVFVPSDVSFLGLGADEVNGVSDRLLPLVAHDRAEFGAGMMTMGFLTAAAAWKGIGVYGRSLWLAIAVAGYIHFSAVIASHFLVGYTDFMHLAPVYGAAALLALALGAWRPRAARTSRVLAGLTAQASATPIDSSRPSI